jgi:uncharacterized membrane protein SpoIIM required for sporulation
MLEMLLNPRRAEKRPIEMLFVGLFYSLMSLILTNWIFSGPVLAKYSGIVVVTFTVMFSMPFMYYLLRHEEEKDMKYEGSFKVIKEHSRAILSLLWLFVGFVIAFAAWYILTGYSHNFQAQIETYCYINHPSNFEMCVEEYASSENVTGFASGTDRFFTIFFNNIYVLMFTIIFSLIFGGGAIFILAWNASVIAVAMGIFTKMNINQLPMSFIRYMIHGLPEIAAYFIGAVAGGIISMAVIKQDFDRFRFKEIIQDFVNLIILAIVLLLFAGLAEVFVIGFFA